MHVDKQQKTVTIKQNTAINISLAFLLVIAGALMTATTAFVEMKNRVHTNERSIQALSDKTNRLDTETINARVEFSKIQTQLLNIETNIIEIKERL